jgi:amino acid transporter
MAWFCVTMFIIILLFNGFAAFIHSFSVATFFASYVTLPVVFFSFVGFRIYRTRTGGPVGFVSLEEINLSHGPEQALRGTKYDLGAGTSLVEPVLIKG